MSWVRNPDYHVSGLPYPDRREWPMISEYAARLAQFKAGNIYIENGTETVAKQDLIATLAEQPNLLLIENGAYESRIYDIRFGYAGDSPFRDVRNRQALSMMIDAEGFANAIDEADTFKQNGIDIESRRNTIISANFPSWLDPMDESEFGANHKYLKLNIAEAKKLMAAAGFPDGFQFNYVINTDSNYSPPYLRVCDILAGMFTTGGAKPNYVAIPSYNTFYENHYIAYSSAVQEPRPYSGATVIGAIRGGIVMGTYLFSNWHPDGGWFNGMTPDGNNAHRGDSKVTDLINKIRAEFDANRQTPLVHDLVRYHAGQAYNIVRPTSARSFAAVWPVVGNAGVYRTPTGLDSLYYWVDDSKPPLATS
jgi:ABC-type transport system substrate-binding protein